MSISWLSEPVLASPALLVGEEPPEEARTAAPWMSTLAASVPEAGRVAWRREVAAWLAPTALGASRRAGVPVALWERLLDLLTRAQAPHARPAARPVVAPDAPDQAALGAQRGGTTEWFGLTEPRGAYYKNELWAWGLVSEAGADAPCSPRVAWAPTRDGWRPDPRFERLWASAGLPTAHLAGGPGVLLAALLEAVERVVPQPHLKARDRAVVWSALLLPLLAPTAVGRAPAPSALAGVPDYQAVVAFHVLHPRAQAAVLLLDDLATAVAAEDRAALPALAEALGCPATLDAVVRATGDLLRKALGRRDAAAGWDAGMGYRLFRKVVLEELRYDDAQAFLDSVDQAFHAEVEAAPGGESRLGALGTRLKNGFRVALTFPGESGRPYPGGPAAAKAADLAWLKWSHEDYLHS